MQPGEQPESNIAMWGTPGSGKTTFLAALSIALNRRRDGWKVVGAEQASTDALVRMTNQLAADRTFPRATEGMERYQWVLMGRSEEKEGRWPRRRKVTRGVRIGLDMLDPSGEFFGRRHAGNRDMLVERLVGSRGIVYLFDPVREYEKGDAFDYLHGVLAHLSQRMLNTPEFTDGLLPHYLAVCVTKFDELRVLKTAKHLDLVTTDPDDPLDFPRVDSEDGRELFRQLCEVSATGNAEMVVNTLEQYFRPDRIKFFVTSAIGFHVNPRTGAYDPNDPQNLVPTAADPSEFRIRGTVHPINVMEPMLWLGQRLSAEQG